jgi:NTE family protein
MAKTAREPVLVDLGLQGGGSHGAFTWGVLDRLMEEPWLRIEAISGTSAGAMNAALVADGWTQSGAEGARTALGAYWRRVSQATAFSPLQRSPLDPLDPRIAEPYHRTLQEYLRPRHGWNRLPALAK